MPFLSAITPSHRGVKELQNIMNDFRNQTLPKESYEHVIVYDGTPPPEITEFMKKDHGYNIQFFSIEKDLGNMSIAPGTKPRNYGIEKARGEYVIFCDDDDRYKDTYCESLVAGMQEGIINVVQMSCQESRMYRNGDPNRVVLVPEVGLPQFPMICHVGTPCFIVPRKWALEDPWREEKEHDFRFIKRIVDKHKPRINIRSGMQVDVDGLVIRDMKDWVTHPPLYR